LGDFLTKKHGRNGENHFGLFVKEWNELGKIWKTYRMNWENWIHQEWIHHWEKMD
jgi:hypothetical protein